MWATLAADVWELTRPMYSSMSLGLLPEDWMRVGCGIRVGMRFVRNRLLNHGEASRCARGGQPRRLSPQDLSAPQVHLFMGKDALPAELRECRECGWAEFQESRRSQAFRGYPCRVCLECRACSRCRGRHRV